MSLNSKRGIKFVATILALGLLSLIAVTFALRDRPVLAVLHNDIRDHHGFQLLNPFRDRSPERAADDFLVRLSRGDCSTVLTQLGEDASRKQSVCDSERKYPMKGWQLEAIGQDGYRTLLRYGVSREANRRTVKDPFWIWVSKDNHQDYQVTGYELWY
jgi:hypothetical protein